MSFLNVGFSTTAGTSANFKGRLPVKIGLPVRNLLLDQGVIRITPIARPGQVQTVKSRSYYST